MYKVYIHFHCYSVFFFLLIFFLISKNTKSVRFNLTFGLEKIAPLLTWLSRIPVSELRVETPSCSRLRTASGRRTETACRSCTSNFDYGWRLPSLSSGKSPRADDCGARLGSSRWTATDRQTVSRWTVCRGSFR